MKKLSVAEPAAHIAERINALDNIQKGLSSAAERKVLGGIIAAYRAVQTDLQSKAFKDPYRSAIFEAQARLRDVATPTHQRAVYQEMIDVLSRGGQ